MDEQLKHLKRAMNKHTFSTVAFTDEQRSRIHAKLAMQIESELFLLLTEKKTATELIQLLHVKGVTGLQQNEGIVFSALHEAELAGEVEGVWSEQGKKTYTLTKKGVKKYVVQEVTRAGWSIKSLFHEVRPHES